MKTKFFNDSGFLKVFLFVSVFLVGGYHLALSCILSLILLLFIIYKTISQKNFLCVKPNVVLATIFFILISYLVVTLWAVDKGSAIYGFFKILPVALFTLLMSVYDKSAREEVLQTIPYAAASSGVVAYGLSFVPQLSDFFLVSGRLGGFFQSPNIFAIFCLAGIIILLADENLKIKDIAVSAVLMVLILLTGSRTVFLFMLVAIFVLILKIKNQKIKFSVLSIAVFLILASAVIAVATGNVETIGRFLTISSDSSTLLGRLLYYLDAIPVILKHPFGLGYFGYYFTQGTFQTGVYAVAFVHNSVLQFMLDIGIIPAIAFCLIVIGSFFSKRSTTKERLLIFVLFGHSLFDFDMEFVAIFFTLILTLDFDLFKKKDYEFRIKTPITICVSAVLICFSVYFALVNSFYLFGEYNAVDKIYGHDTMSKMYLLTTERNQQKLTEYADEIIKENGNLAVAYDYKANEAFSKGQFKDVIEYKRNAVRCSPYLLSEYTDFCDKMMVGISLYTKSGDLNSAEACKKELVAIRDMIADVEERTSFLAWKIYNKPELELPEEYVSVIEEYDESE